MKSSIPNATKADLERFRRLQELGCIASYIRSQVMGTPGDVHHLLSGGLRISHQHTICLTPWFHRGEPPVGYSVIRATEELGPSRARNHNAFTKIFGTDEQLLEMTNQLLEAIRKGRAA